MKSNPIELEYKCNNCDEIHRGPPSIGFTAPDYFLALTDAEKEQSFLSSDGCVILNKDFFIRAMLEVPINGTGQFFYWGVWVSQSKEDFQFYNDHFKDDLTGRVTFGWLSNQILGYEDTLGLETTVSFMKDDQRPKVAIKKADHQLAVDFEGGMSRERAVEISQMILNKE